MAKRPNKPTENYYSGAHELEGPLALNTLGITKLDTELAWKVTYQDAIRKAKDLGLTRDEVEYCIETDLQLYGYKADTFPYLEWIGEIYGDGDYGGND